jgi:peroxiredoxin
MKNNKKSILCACLVFFLGAAAVFPADELKAGSIAPDFTFTAPDGKTMKLSDYRGKPVALHFWATWCGPCKAELPLISELTVSKSRELTVLAVDCGETDQDVSRFLSKRKYNLNVVMDKDDRISRLYNITAIPQTYMIDAEGRIRSIQIGSYNQARLNRDVSALLD